MPKFVYGLWQKYRSAKRSTSTPVIETHFDDSDRFKQYRYETLRESEREIRYFDLLPGEVGDSIVVRINTISLKGHKLPIFMPDLGKARALLPRKWEAYLTPEDRILYFNQISRESSWHHPNPRYEDRVDLEDYTQPFRLPFEALSYTWGGNICTTETIYVETSATTIAILAVTSNVVQALEALRDSSRPRSLWVDAICIDQSDLQERASQVAKMSVVYKSAQKVVVWLGPASRDSDLALKTLTEIGKCIEAETDEFTAFPAPGQSKSYAHYMYGRDPISSIKSAAISALLSRPWFKRVWIRQEIQLASPASIIACGHISMTWHRLRRAICVLERMSKPMIAGQGPLSHMHRLGEYWQDLYLSTLVRRAATGRCSDPRDYIYGTLALARPGLTQYLEIDYASSVTQVFRSALVAESASSGKLGLLEAISLASQESQKPIFSTISGCLNLAAGCSLAIVEELQETGKPLRLTGCLHSRVVDAFDLCNTPGDLTSRLRTVYRRRLCDVSATNSLSQSWGNTLASTFCLGKTRSRFPDQRYPDLEQWCTMFKGRREFSRIAHKEMEDVRSCSVIDFEDGSIAIGPSNALPGESFSSLSRGYAAQARLGDVAVVLLGCNYPFILRPQASGRYVVIGPCYIESMMCAEALLGPLPDNWILYYSDSPQYAAFWYFKNTLTGESTTEDPRLGPLPMRWERLEDVEDGMIWISYRNLDTGEIMPDFTDPRMLPEALEARGVIFQQFIV